ncbi:class I SAM-dependent methyltransferase [Mongoliitalea daihaiensis]|uniref:class I SAM-dependent methyltransferase n=1 Tax=Mongoliitalea daihaiensis TaxID=2782006 RepID=UPI001F28C8DD|nr:class I SAM-dependent methyltransferase [Mongoliitalea daihaiensis]UJP65557.1 RsmD family RNA methyltransferase [Mongoliitalea daihaiensis]
MDFSQEHIDKIQLFVQDHLMEDPAQILLRYSGKVDFNLKFAVQQIQARQKAKSKIPKWYANESLLFPVSLSMEQASSEETANYKASLLSGETFADLTGGLGIDSYFIGRNFKKATYCERNEELFKISQHNLEKLSPAHFECINGDSIAWLKSRQDSLDWIFIDPARRGNSNQKLYKLSDCEPNVVDHAKLLVEKGENVMIKASPMLDIKQALKELPYIQQVIVLDVRNEVKEVLLIGGKSSNQQPVSISCVSLHPSFENGFRQFDFTFEEEEESFATLGSAEKYLIEPQSSILKAGGFQLFALRHNLKKLGSNTHLYTSTSISDQIPGRVFEILCEIHHPKKELNALVPDGKINVLTRNYSMGAEELKKKFRLKDGGNQFLIGAKEGANFKLWIGKLA